MLFCFKIAIRSLRNAIESKFRFGRCNMIVGGVLRIRSSVEVIVGVRVSVDVDVAVKVNVGVEDGGRAVEVFVTGG